MRRCCRLLRTSRNLSACRTTHGLPRNTEFLSGLCKGTKFSVPMGEQPDQGAMEPYMDAFYPPPSNSASNVPINLASESLNPQNTSEEVDLEPEYELDPAALRSRYTLDKQRYRSMRRWSKRCRREKAAHSSEEAFSLRLLSFNILAQYLLETYPYLYKRHDRHALPWRNRRPLILEEILEAQADVICLQEMQEEHLQEFLGPLQERGYAHLYKKRTNDKRDGLLFLYRTDQLELLDYVKVELYQSGIELLSRDNVGIVAKLCVKKSPETQLVVATTHLLYNPKRNDVRLGQTQLLLAEIERIAFIKNTSNGPRYLPIILAGDFNLEPYTGVYEFITRGSFEYRGKGRNLEPSDYRRLSNSLIPSRLCVTDNCQHFDVLKRRLRGEKSGKIMLENSEERYGSSSNQTLSDCEVNVDSADAQTIVLDRECEVRFSSGVLTHPFNLQSVYRHQTSQKEREATTDQGEWITVDYIFYSDLEPTEVYLLPSVSECKNLPTIPNFAVGSDHLCLGASFRVFKRKC